MAHTHYPMIIEWQGPTHRRDICECGYFRHVVLLYGAKVYEDWLPGNPPDQQEKKTRHVHKPVVDVLVEDHTRTHKHICKCGAVRYISDNNGLYPNGSTWNSNASYGERFELYLLEK